MKINRDESKITGNWIYDGFKIIADDACKRIEWLRVNYLIYSASDESGWSILYQDPNDKRYWQFYFEKGEMQAGGPPCLICLSESDAKALYKF